MMIRGTVLEQSGSRFVPVVGADVSVSGIWQTLPEVVTQKASPPNMISLQPPLYHDRGKSTPCQLGSLRNVGPDQRTLLVEAPRGSTRLYVSNVVNLKVGDVVCIDGNRPERTEILSVVSIDPPAFEAQPSWIAVDWPLTWEHHAQAAVDRLEVEWSASTHIVKFDGHRGEACVFLDSIDEVVTDGYLKIGGGSMEDPAEYHRFALFRTKSRQDGRYQLPLLQRVAQLTIAASKAEGKSKELKWQPDYSLPINQVDIVLS